jgi:hypothetical protein
LGFRTLMAPSEEDRQLSMHLEKAIRELEYASDLVRKQTKSRETRALDIHKDLQRYIVGLRMVETLVPKRSRIEDPDSLSEEELAKRSRERFAQKKAAKALTSKGKEKGD